MPNPHLAAALAEQQELRAQIVAQAEGFETLTIPALRDEISRRNEGRAEAEQITPDGANKPDLIKALEADDAVESEKQNGPGIAVVAHRPGPTTNN